MHGSSRILFWTVPAWILKNRDVFRICPTYFKSFLMQYYFSDTSRESLSPVYGGEIVSKLSGGMALFVGLQGRQYKCDVDCVGMRVHFYTEWNGNEKNIVKNKRRGKEIYASLIFCITKIFHPEIYNLCLSCEELFIYSFAL